MLSIGTNKWKIVIWKQQLRSFYKKRESPLGQCFNEWSLWKTPYTNQEVAKLSKIKHKVSCKTGILLEHNADDIKIF
jgi:hypothetical protein